MTNTTNCFRNVSSSVSLYKEELAGHEFDTLTSQEEKALFSEYKRGSLKAMHRIVNSNLRYAQKVAEYYISRFGGKDEFFYDEIISSARLGLVEAISHFDSERDVRFVTFANSYIVKYILAFIDKQVNIDDTRTDIDGYDRSTEEDFDIDGVMIDVMGIIDVYLSEREKYVIMHKLGVGGAKRLKVKEIAKNLDLTEESIRLASKSAIDKIKEHAHNYDWCA